jgi:predicted RNA binding protein YcfA (HicA-like mRNA interferase family)
MPVMTAKKLLELIKKQGFIVRRTTKGHYVVVDPRTGIDTNGRFAIGHGSNKGIVLGCYVKNVLRAIGL